ncbi:MAG TPA: hypothetical protein VKU91_08905 [Acidimicrobiales bacterium]|nr:hypothetical protein [Acidimicrobiales bacterium]
MRWPAEGADRPAVVAVSGLACADVADVLPGVVDGSADLSARQAAHVDACLRCQAELARYRHLVRVLRSLGPDLASHHLDEALLRHLEAASASRHPQLARRAAYVGGVVVATAASAAGVLVWASRRRDLAS